jgi:hypothetical protein
VLLYTPAIGVTGSDWWWIGLAVVLDLAHWGATAGQRGAAPRRAA